MSIAAASARTQYRLYSAGKGALAAPPKAAVCQMISSFEKKPAKGQMPAIASVAIHIVTQVMGMNARRPPMLRMSWASSWLCVA